MPTKVEISHKTIIFTFVFLILCWLIIQVKEIILLVSFAFIIMSAFKPWVDQMEKFRIPRIISVLIIYFGLILIVAFGSGSIIPPLVSQSVKLSERLPEYLTLIFPFIKFDSSLINQYVAPVSQNLFKVTLGLFSNVVGIFSIFVVSFYLLLGRKHLDEYLVKFIGEKSAKRIVEIVDEIENRMGGWVRAQLTLMLAIGVSTFIGLMLLGIPYALPLAIFAGLLEIIPSIGPIVSAIPAILVALTMSPFLALATAALYLIVQQLENNLLVPLVMKQATGMPPLVTILAILIGGKLAGIVGAIIAIPVVLLVETIITYYFRLKSEKV